MLTRNQKIAELRKLSQPRPCRTYGPLDLALESFRAGIRVALKAIEPDEQEKSPSVRQHERAVEQ